MPGGGPDQPRITAVVVTYQPDALETGRLLRALAPQVTRTVVVDNGSEPALLAALADAIADTGAELVPLPSNVGIGAAQNVGIARARAAGTDLVLLSDQDSEPAADMVERLRAGLRRAQAQHERVAAVGPVTVDERVEGATLLFASRRWGPRRADVPAEPGALVPVAFLLASGCLVEERALTEVGPMNEAWFIDHVDLEWGLRARRAGWELFGVTGAHLGHHLGDRAVRLPGRGREVHIHSATRNYYMVRNTILLVRSRLMPTAWRVGYVVWILKYAGFYTLAVAPRRRRLWLMLRGLVDALRRRTGPLVERPSA